MKFDSSQKVQEVVWTMRDSERDRSENRVILNRQYNGDPPFSETEVAENNIQVNRNTLKGVQVLADARRQWNTAFLSQPNYFTVRLEEGPPEKREAWGRIITRELNRRLKKSRAMLEQVRATGATTMLHGIGPVTWPDKDNPYPTPLPIDSLLIPSQTEIDFENLTYFAVFREWTPAQLHELTSKKNVDPGWNMPLVKSLIKRKLSEDLKAQSDFTEQSPEKVEELIKQDGGYYGSDAVPTIDVWDFYFRESEDGEGWYRRVILEWSEQVPRSTNGRTPMPERKNKDEADFLYSSGTRKYADSLSEILHCQFGDCSAVAPFKYHSVRSLGWLMWGVCDLINRMDCRITESTFENLMWFFRTASQNDLERIKKASFHNMGVIPSGIAFVTAQERYTPDANLIQLSRGGLQAQVNETATSYTQDWSKGETGREITATETMARVNSANALVSGMMTLAYLYEEFKYREIARRFSHGNHAHAVAFRKACLNKGVPKQFLDSAEWTIKADQVIGAGNKTVEYAAVQVLQGIRKNLSPSAQRRIDNITIASVTDQPELADALAPLDEIQEPSKSAHDAELATDRLLSGLPFGFKTDMVMEDYAKTWLRDLALVLQQAMGNQANVTPTDVAGYTNLANHIGKALQIMSSDDEAKPKIRQYSDALGQLMNYIKGLAQRLAQKQQAQGPQVDPETMSKIQSDQIIAQAKAQNLRESHAQKTAQRQVQFEKDEARKDRQAMAEIHRSTAVLASDLQNEAVKTTAEAIKTANKPNETETNVPEDGATS